MDEMINQIIAGKFIIKKLIGEGAFGKVYQAISNEGGEYAVKIEPANAPQPLLHHEAQIYQELKGISGIPRIHYFGAEKDNNILVLDLLGPSLEELLCYCGGKFSVKTVLIIADQLLARLEAIHKTSIIHRDVKPDNFLIGLGKAVNVIHVVDMGLAKYYCDPQSRTHIPYRDGKALTGTVRYVSVNSHLGIEQSRRDDLESLGYIFIYLLKGKLPWQGLKVEGERKRYEKILEIKISTSFQTLCEGIPGLFN